VLRHYAELHLTSGPISLSRSGQLLQRALHLYEAPKRATALRRLRCLHRRSGHCPSSAPYHFKPDFEYVDCDVYIATRIASSTLQPPRYLRDTTGSWEGIFGIWQRRSGQRARHDRQDPLMVGTKEQSGCLQPPLSWNAGELLEPMS
jgi:hypothetical protein